MHSYKMHTQTANILGGVVRLHSVTQDRCSLWILVTTIMKVRIPYKVENFLTS